MASWRAESKVVDAVGVNGLAGSRVESPLNGVGLELRLRPRRQVSRCAGVWPCSELLLMSSIGLRGGAWGMRPPELNAALLLLFHSKQ